MSMSEIKHESAPVDAVATGVSASGKKKKSGSKSFKRRVKKIFGGESKKKAKKKTKDGEVIPDTSEYRIIASEPQQDKISTASSFDDEKKSVDENAPSPVSTVDSMPGGKGDDNSFRIVLLLLDPETRRFELFHLDFESSQITVSEVLAQSSDSITAESLQKVTYSGLMGSDGVHRSGNDLLSTFCIGNDVLVGIPDNTSAEKIVQLASPILVDKNIVQMISDSGADTTPWKKNISSSTTEAPSTPVRKDNKPREVVAPASREERMEPTNNQRSLGQPATESKSGGGGKHMFIIMIELALAVFLLYQYSLNSGYIAVPATLRDLPSLIPQQGHNNNQNNEQLYSCVRTCVDNMFVPGEDTTTTTTEEEVSSSE